MRPGNPDHADYAARTGDWNLKSLMGIEIPSPIYDFSPVGFCLGIVRTGCPVEGQDGATAMTNSGISLKEIFAGIERAPLGRYVPCERYILDALLPARKEIHCEIFTPYLHKSLLEDVEHNLGSRGLIDSLNDRTLITHNKLA
jgi:hypothetical protein